MALRSGRSMEAPPPGGTRYHGPRRVRYRPADTRRPGLGLRNEERKRKESVPAHPHPRPRRPSARRLSPRTLALASRVRASPRRLSRHSTRCSGPRGACESRRAWAMARPRPASRDHAAARMRPSRRAQCLSHCLCLFYYFLVAQSPSSTITRPSRSLSTLRALGWVNHEVRSDRERATSVVPLWAYSSCVSQHQSASSSDVGGFPAGLAFDPGGCGE
jgi:hypothetical protein